MEKVAIVVLASNESHGDLGRVVNALGTAKEFQTKGDDVKIIFDGGGTEWVPTLADEEHRAHGLYAAVEESIAGACKYCAGAFDVTDGVKAAGVPLLDDNEGHPSLRALMTEGYQVLTF